MHSRVLAILEDLGASVELLGDQVGEPHDSGNRSRLRSLPKLTADPGEGWAPELPALVRRVDRLTQ